MKNVFGMLLCIVALVSCSDSKEDNVDRFPIAYLLLPTLAEGELFQANTEITIQGKGFNELSEIWFNSTAITKTELDAVKAELVSVDDKQITVLAPTVYDSQDLVLKQNEKFYPLGTLVFAPEPQLMSIKEFTIAKSESDFFKASFEYQDSKLSIIKMSYPFFKKVKELTVTISYEGDKISKIITKDGKRLMSDATVTYKSETEVLVNNVESKAYTYKFDDKGLLVARTDSRGDAKLAFTYDDKGNMKEYILTYYGNKPETTTFTYDENRSMFAVTDMPKWLWNYVLTDVLSSDLFMQSFISFNNALTVGDRAINYTYNAAKQPQTISLNDGVKASEVIYVAQ